MNRPLEFHCHGNVKLWTEGLLIQGLVPIVEVMQEFETSYDVLQSLNEAEKIWYDILKMSGCQMINFRRPGSFPEMTQETREKIRAAQIHRPRKGHRAWNKGRTTPLCVREKMSKRNIGRAAWNKGKRTPEEVRIKMCNSHLGHVAWNKGRKKIIPDVLYITPAPC